MLSNHFSFDARTLRVSALAVLGAVALAACDKDRPLATQPTVAKAPTAAEPAMIAKGGILSIQIVDQKNQAVTTLGSQFTIASGSGGATYFAVDNVGNDSDPAIGSIRVPTPIGKFEVCQTVAPTDYVLANPSCQTVAMNAGTVATLTFVDLTVPHMAWKVVDFNNKPVAGATVKVWDGVGYNALTDNGPGDLDPAPGQFEIKTSLSGMTVCPLTPPTGWTFAVMTCVGMPTVPGQTTFMISFAVNPEYSAYWYATDYTNQVGPSEYEVTDAAGNVVTTIIDDTKNDIWAGMGKLWVTLPADGDYVVCQTQAPPNTNLADSPCRKFSVKFGVPTYVGLFNSKPI